MWTRLREDPLPDTKFQLAVRTPLLVGVNLIVSSGNFYPVHTHHLLNVRDVHTYVPKKLTFVSIMKRRV